MTPRALALFLSVVASGVALTGCKTTDDVTAAAMNRDVAATYGHLKGEGARAACVRHRGHGPQFGAGKDWSCTVNGAAGSRTYSVTARPNGCYTATDSATGPVVTGPRNLSPTAILPSFDGCLPA